jgi:hypothetical protein
MGANRFDSDTKGESGLRVRPVLPQQHEHFALARGEEWLGDATRWAGGEKLELKTPRRQVDRVPQIPHLDIHGEAHAGAESQQLSRVDAGQTIPKQHQMRLRMLDRYLSDLGEVTQQSDIKDEHAWALHPKRVIDARNRDVSCNDRDAHIGFESGIETQSEKVREASDGDSDR